VSDALTTSATWAKHLTTSESSEAEPEQVHLQGDLRKIPRVSDHSERYCSQPQPDIRDPEYKVTDMYQEGINTERAQL